MCIRSTDIWLVELFHLHRLNSSEKFNAQSAQPPLRLLSSILVFWDGGRRLLRICAFQFDFLPISLEFRHFLRHFLIIFFISTFSKLLLDSLRSANCEVPLLLFSPRISEFAYQIGVSLFEELFRMLRPRNSTLNAAKTEIFGNFGSFTIFKISLLQNYFRASSAS